MFVDRNEKSILVFPSIRPIALENTGSDASKSQGPRKNKRKQMSPEGVKGNLKPAPDLLLKEIDLLDPREDESLALLLCKVFKGNIL